MHKVAVLVGSLRRESINMKLAKALAKLAQPKLDFNIIDLSTVPMYNDDLWANPPAGVVKLKADIAAADGVLFVTPEYNRSPPAVLTNAIDWATRPRGDNSWGGKPGGVVGTSPGVIGTAAAQALLRSTLPVVGISLMAYPEVYLSSKPGLIDDNFVVTDEGTRKFLGDYLTAFDAWVSRLKSSA